MTTTAPVVEDESADEGRAPRPHLWWPGVLAVSVPTAVAVVHASIYGAWIEDDAGITFAYARSLATGAGPVLQPGAVPVEGFSDPLWLGLLIVGHWLGLFDRGAWFGSGVSDLVWFPKLLGLACLAGTFACMYRAARAVVGRPALLAGAAGVVSACIPPFVIWAVSGLENGLYALFVVALATELVRGVAHGTLLTARRAAVCGILAAGAGLTRPDGLIYVAAFPLAVVSLTREYPSVSRRWAVVRSVTAFTVPTLIYLLLRLLWFGDWLPATARAKSQGLPDAASLLRPSEIVTYIGWLFTIVLVVVVSRAFTARIAAGRGVLIALIVPLGLAVVVYGILDPDWMGYLRFAAPVWPLTALLGAIALTQLWPVLDSVRARGFTAGTLVVALVSSVAFWLPNAMLFRSDPVFTMCRWAVQGQSEILNGVADRLQVPNGQGSFVGTDAGGVALTSRLRYIDAFGLTDARIARYRQVEDNAAVRSYIFDEQRPTFYLIYTDWDEWWKGHEGPHLRDDPRFARDYVQVWRAQEQSPKTGIWVRRDSVPNLSALTAARSYADAARTRHGEMYTAPDSQIGWSCGGTLRPGTDF